MIYTSVSHLEFYLRRLAIIHNHFMQQMGTNHNRPNTPNWDEFMQDQYDLVDLEHDITEDEVKTVIMGMSNDKALGPDEFIGLFFKSCWSIIKADLCRVFHQLSQLRGSMFNLLNSVNVVLIRRDQ